MGRRVRMMKTMKRRGQPRERHMNVVKGTWRCRCGGRGISAIE